VLLPLLVAASAVTARPAPPSEAARLSAALGPVRGKVGSWAEYLIRSRGEQDVRVRLSLVPPALEEDRSWLEVTVLGERTLPFAARLLVGSKGGLERAVVYALGQAPIELPVGEPQPEAPKSDRPARARRIGDGTVTVPAGTFEVEALRVGAGGGATRVWRASRVPLWGLVRAEGPRQTVELTAYGFEGAGSVFPDVQGKGSESTK
jgi:hypothetical protein